MLRTVLALLLATALAGPASAANLVSDYADARKLFLGDTEDMGSYFSDFRKTLFDGIEGTYAPLVLLQPLSDQLIATACKRLPMRWQIKDEYTLELVSYAGTDNAFTTTFVSRGGSAFAQTVDVPGILHRLGLDTENAPTDAISNVLNTNSGMATILRPSRDLIVVQTNYGPPQIYGRCPD